MSASGPQILLFYLSRMLALQFPDMLREQNSFDSFGASATDYHP